MTNIDYTMSILNRYLKEQLKKTILAGNYIKLPEQNTRAGPLCTV